MKEHCSDCHSSESAEGGFDLEQLRNPRQTLIHFRQAKRVIEHVHSKTMPPDPDAIDDAARQRIISGITKIIDHADWDSLRATVRPMPLRLSRLEYENTVEDRLGIRVDLRDLLDDEPIGANGFSVDRSSRMITPQHAENFLRVAKRCAQVLLDPRLITFRQNPWEHEVQAEEARRQTIAGTRSIQCDDNGVTAFRFMRSRGVKYQQVSASINVPATGCYSLTLHAQSKGTGSGGLWVAIDSVGQPSERETVLVDNQDWSPYTVDLFLTAGNHEIIIGSDMNAAPWLPAVPEHPQRKLPFPRDAVVDAFYDQLDVQPVQWQELQQLEGFAQPVSVDAKAESMHELEEINRLLLDENIRVTKLMDLYRSHHFLPVLGPSGLRNSASNHQKNLAMLIGVEQEEVDRLWRSHEPQQHVDNEAGVAVLRKRWGAMNRSRNQCVADVMLDRFVLRGPLISQTAATIQDQIAAGDAGKVIADALGNPSNHESLRDLIDGVLRKEVESGTVRTTAVERSLVAALMSPQFLLADRGTESADDLAVRWSLLLWQSADPGPLADSLRDAFESRDPTAQIQSAAINALNDPRSERMMADFTSQWLGLASLGHEKVPDSELFREFSIHLARDMRKEVAMRWQDIVDRDGSLLELLDGPKTFVNERLARLYGMEGIRGTQFQAVALDDPSRRGLLGTAAVLTATSLGRRTSPVQRGLFVVETLLGEDLPPPPDDAGTLPEDAGDSRSLSLREQLAAHRDSDNCRGCHSRIDPIGFALESFDYTGRKRTTTVAGPVDDLATMTDGTEVSGTSALVRYLRDQRSTEFVDHVTRRFAAYALGRTLDHRDESELRRIVANVRDNDNSARAMVLQVMTSSLMTLNPKPIDNRTPRSKEE
ncbi:MAG: DUF1588 domain-containing protein [Planctomycetota bacterium]